MEELSSSDQTSITCEAVDYLNYLKMAADRIVDPMRTGHAHESIVGKRTYKAYFDFVDALTQTEIPKCESCPVSADVPATTINCPVRSELDCNIEIGQGGFAFSRYRVKRTMEFLGRASTLADKLRLEDQQKH